MMLGIDRNLDVVAHHARAAPARRHRAAVGIGERDLAIGRGQHPPLVRVELAHFLFQLGKLLLEVRCLDGQGFRRLLPVGRLQLPQVAQHALLELSAPPVDLVAREVLVAVVHGFELGAVDGDACLRQQPHLPAQLDKPHAHLLDGRSIVFPEIGDDLVVGRKPTEQPDHLEIAARLTLEAAARGDAIEIAVDVEPEQNRGMIARPTRRLGHDLEPQFGEIEMRHERLDRAHRIALADVVVEALGQQRELRAIRFFDEPLHAPAPAANSQAES